MLNVDNARLHYGAAEALRGVTLKADTARITCVLGRNGVGKTSLMRAIVGHHKLSSGSISFEGKVLDRSAPSERARSGIAFVPQGREIFPLLTVRENLETGYAGLKRADRHIPDHVFELFPVLKDMLGRRGGDLSGGQQQQLAIGRALVTRPKVLILDEPTEGIQPNIVKQIHEVIVRLNREFGLTVILVEQNVPFARRVSDSFLVMDKGRIVISGAGADLTDAVADKHLTF